MTKVINLLTGDEMHYSLDPREAVNAAYEQSRGNYNTWSYSDTLPEVKQTSLHYYRGDFTAKIEEAIK